MDMVDAFQSAVETRQTQYAADLKYVEIALEALKSEFSPNKESFSSFSFEYPTQDEELDGRQVRLGGKEFYTVMAIESSVNSRIVIFKALLQIQLGQREGMGEPRRILTIACPGVGSCIYGPTEPVKYPELDEILGTEKTAPAGRLENPHAFKMQVYSALQKQLELNFHLICEAEGDVVVWLRPDHEEKF